MDKYKVDLDGNYMQYQRKTIRKLTLRNKLLIVIALIMLVANTYLLVKVVDLKADNKFLQDDRDSLLLMIEEKNKEIENLSQDINDRIIKAVKKITGKTLQKTVDVVYLEAGNQGEIGMQLVVDTIFNRVESPEFTAKSVAEVIRYPKQFNALSKLHKITPEVRQSETYLVAQDLVYDRLINDTALSKDVLYFMNYEYSSRGNATWMRSKDFVLKYKDHEFYK